MIDKDGIERPDNLNDNMLKIKHDKRKIKFDETYNYRPRNIFFRMWASFFKAVGIIIVKPAIAIKFRLKIRGKENLKKFKKKAFIITCNHVHVLDDLTVGSNLFPTRKIYFTTLSRNIQRPVVGFFMRTLGGIPIPSGSVAGMKKFNEDISYLLKKGKPVMYNPEAALWPYYREIRPFKRGAFVTAVKNDVPVLPIVVTFKRKKKRNGKFKYRFFYTVCEPIEIDKSLPDKKHQSEKLMNQTHDVMDKVAKEFYASQDCGFDDDKKETKKG